MLFQAAVLANAVDPWVVKEGDTLFAIARKQQVPLDVLREFNGFPQAIKLKVGQLVRVPEAYTVKKGDTLYGIARDLSVPLSAVLDLNGLTQSSRIIPGQKLFVPASARAVTVPSGGVTAPASGDQPPAGQQPAGQQPGSQQPSGQPPGIQPSGAQPQGIAQSSTGLGQGQLAAGGAFVWPHPGRREPYAGRLPGLLFHGAKGDLVQSATAGEVEWVAPYLGYGIAIIIRAPDKSLITYKGNEAALVSVGDRVIPGTEIARLGISPLLGGDARLYLSIKDSKGQTVDPEKYLSIKNQA